MLNGFLSEMLLCFISEITEMYPVGALVKSSHWTSLGTGKYNSSDTRFTPYSTQKANVQVPGFTEAQNGSSPQISNSKFRVHKHISRESCDLIILYLMLKKDYSLLSWFLDKISRILQENILVIKKQICKLNAFNKCLKH